jgi:hypothetical protein
MPFWLLFKQKKRLLPHQIAHYLAVSDAVTKFWLKNLAGAPVFPAVSGGPGGRLKKIDLESAAFLFHMSGMQPESSGQRELRVP